MNWQQIVIDLRRLGLGQTEIARELDCSQGYISDIEHGRRANAKVGYDFGVALIALHKRHMRNAKRRKKNP